MRFERTAGTDDVDTYGRWVSNCGNFSVQRFTYRKIAGFKDHQSVNPYFRIYFIAGRSEQIAERIKTWKQVTKICKEFEKTSTYFQQRKM